MKPKGIVDYLFPWFIPLFCFLSGYFLGTVIKVDVKPVATVERSI